MRTQNNNGLSEYISKLSSGISAVKKTVLTLLWQSDNAGFPKPWVSTEKLLEATGNQKYFDRRIRELRDEQGCDIESGFHSYRLVSKKLNKPNPRKYLSALQKSRLFIAHDYICSACTEKMQTGELQADHKIPLIRGGKHIDYNWQPLCVGCNVGKRAACKGCSADCTSCPWAFPEKVGIRTFVRLPPELLNALKETCSRNQADVEELIIKTLKKEFNIT